MKKLISILAMVATAGLVFASDVDTAETVKKIRKGTTEKKHRIESLHVEGAANIGGALTAGSIVAPVTGNVTGDVTGNVIGTDVKVADDFIVTPAAQSVTNGQAVTLTSGNLLAGIGQATGLTNLITVAAPGASMVGKVALIAVHGATSSNLVSIADVAPCDLSSDWVGGVGDTLMLWGVSATEWKQLGAESDN